MRRRSYLLLLLIVFSSSAFSQEKSDEKEKGKWLYTKFFHTLKATVVADYFHTASPDLVLDNNAVLPNRWMKGNTIALFAYSPRVNLNDFGSNASISLNFPFSVALSFIEIYRFNPMVYDPYSTNYFSVDLPVMLHFNYGYHSTYRSIDSEGFTFGTGVRYKLTPLLWDDDHEDINEHKKNANLFQFVVNAGFKSDELYHHLLNGIDLSVGMFDGWSVRVTVIHVLNYD